MRILVGVVEAVRALIPLIDDASSAVIAPAAAPSGWGEVGVRCLR